MTEILSLSYNLVLFHALNVGKEAYGSKAQWISDTYVSHEVPLFQAGIYGVF